MLAQAYPVTVGSATCRLPVVLVSRLGVVDSAFGRPRHPLRHLLPYLRRPQL
jgi:hypothetical protein